MLDRNLKELIKTPIFANFYRVSQVPRPSFKEEKIANDLENWAQDQGLQVFRDDLNNLLIKKPGSPGYEDREPVILQAHTDMVCDQAPGQDHDFDHDPIHLEYEGDIVSTGGRTTLGADNGLGLALAMTLLEDESYPHPPLRALFTTAEEDDLSGAEGVSPSWLDCHRLINLDNSWENILISGSAGGTAAKLSLPMEREEINQVGYSFVDLEVRGLRGGHSGEDIDRGRGNAIQILARVLQALSNSVDFKLLSIEGGNVRMAIPREARAQVAVSKEKKEKFISALNQVSQSIQDRYRETEKGMEIGLDWLEEEGGESSLSQPAIQVLLETILLSPLGINEMFGDRGLAESSMNLGELYEEDGRIQLVYEVRASYQTSLDYLVGCLKILAGHGGGQVETFASYPSWLPSEESPLREAAFEANKEVGIEDLRAAPFHLGLEVAYFQAKVPGMDAISIGPNIRDLHSPQERFSVSSTLKIYKLLKGILKLLAEEEN